MLRLTRAAPIFALVAAFISVPLTMDWCAASCETSQSTTSAASPTCHHTESASPRIGRPPSPCGHDHHAVAAIVATDFVVPSQPISPAVAVASGPYAMSHDVVAAADRAGPEITSLPYPGLVALSLILRI
jgi:hypothetical protein